MPGQTLGHRAKIKVKSTVKIRAKGSHSRIIYGSDALLFIPDKIRK